MKGPLPFCGQGVFDSWVAIFSLRSKFGGLGRNRTTDTRIFNPLLYQLSYQALGERDYSQRLGGFSGARAQAPLPRLLRARSTPSCLSLR